MGYVTATVIGFAFGFVIAEVAYRYFDWRIPAK